jgi:hypothetical protein
MRAFALLLCVPLLAIAQTASPKAAQTEQESSDLQIAEISTYVRRATLRYWEQEEKILTARVKHDSAKVETYKRALDRFEKETKIDLDSDPCETDCGKPERAHSDETFFGVVKLTRLLADDVSSRFGYDGSADWRVSDWNKLKQTDKDEITKFIYCKDMMDFAVENGFFNMKGDCIKSISKREPAAAH